MSAPLFQRVPRLLFALGCLALAPFFAHAAQADDPWAGLKDRLARDGFDRAELDQAFAHEAMAYNPGVMARKMNTLLRIKMKVYTHKPKAEDGKEKVQAPYVYADFLTPYALNKARRYMDTHPDRLASVQKKYGVPPEIMTALLLVETGFGTNLGKHSAFAVLASMAASGDVDEIRDHIKPPEPLTPSLKSYLKKRTLQKSNWAYEELKALLNYAQMLEIKSGDIPGSIYGAIGICQFMPTNVLAYGADGDDDGVIDLFVKADAVHSMANFLKKNGWRPKMSRSRQLKVIYRYNQSWRYTNTIMAVADELKEEDKGR
ncbi:MAG: lytic murein transglycosylase [Desulfovibrionaceae bacterium]